MISFRRTIFGQLDYFLLCSLLVIPVCGLVVLYSAGYDPDSTGTNLGFLPITVKSAPFVRQLIYLIAGCGALGLVALIPGERWSRIAYVLYALVVLALIAVRIPGIGLVSHGARRWFSLGGFYYQPSETMKLVLILTLARYLSKIEVPEGGLGFRDLITPGILVLVPMILIILQPDLGTALSIGILGGMMILFVGVRPKVLVISTVLAFGAAIPAWTHLLHPYQQRRVLSLLNPEESPLGSGYHIVQSKIAVGSGELFGKGFMSGTQTQLGFLPEHTTDFIFSVLSEEWGFLGSTCLIALYLFLILMILRVAAKNRDLFGSLVCVGVASIIFVHVFVNIGMVIGILPVVGITLPLFSYGGSSMISFMSAVGLVVGIQLRRFSRIRGLAAFLPLLLMAKCAAADSPKGRVIFDPLDKSTVSVLLDRISIDPEKLSPLPQGPELGFKQMRDFWAGAETQFETSLSAVLYFSNGNGKPVKAYLTFDGEDHFTIRSSNPRYRDYLGGVRAPFPKLGHTDVFIPGLNGIHMLVVMSDYGRLNNRAVFVCPSREQELAVKSEDPEAEKVGELVDSGYKLEGVGLSVRGSGEGSFIAGTSPGWASASVYVSPHLPLSDPVSDSISNKKPAVDIRYLPPSFDEVKIPFEEESPLAEGLTVEIAFKNSAGLSLIRKSSEILEVRSAPLPTRILIKLKNSVIDTRAAGNCYFVRYQKRQEETRVDPRSVKP